MAHVATDFDGNVRIEYEVTPDLGSAIYIGDTVTITGKIGHKYNNNILSIGANLNHQEVKYINTSPIGPNVVKDFTMEFKVPNLHLEEAINETFLTFNIYDRAGGANGEYLNTVGLISDMSTSYFIYPGYSLVIEFQDMHFVRSSYENGAYKENDEGTNALCKILKIKGSEEIVASDFPTRKIVVTSNTTGDVWDEIEITEDILIATLSENGYSETTPNIFSGKIFELGNEYNIELIIGREDERPITYTSTINRSFANMHLSGATTGGVAIGGFCSATDGNPKFECFYPASFYSGFDPITVKMLGNIMYPVGSIFISYKDTSSQISNMPTQIFGGAWYYIPGFIVGSGFIDNPNSANEYYPLAGSTGKFAASGTSYTYTTVAIWRRVELYDPEKEE